MYKLTRLLNLQLLKWYGHEVSIRVPLFIYDPRLLAKQRGQTLTQLALNIDLATLLGLANCKGPFADYTTEVPASIASVACHGVYVQHRFSGQLD